MNNPTHHNNPNLQWDGTDYLFWNGFKYKALPKKKPSTKDKWKARITAVKQRRKR
jgi:hypothetical protein